MKKHVLLGALLLTAALSAGLTGCSSSGTKESGSPKVEISEIRDDVVEPDFSGADIEVYALNAPINFDYSSSDTDMIFKKKDGVWLDAMDSAIPLNQEKFEAMAQNFLNLHAISEIDSADTASDYGMGNPVYTVTITDSEKGEITLSIGNKDADGNYYLSDEKNIYLVKASTVDSLVFDYDTLVVREGLEAGEDLAPVGEVLPDHVDHAVGQPDEGAGIGQQADGRSVDDDVVGLGAQDREDLLDARGAQQLRGRGHLGAAAQQPERRARNLGEAGAGIGVIGRKQLRQAAALAAQAEEGVERFGTHIRIHEDDPGPGLGQRQGQIGGDGGLALGGDGAGD